MIFRGTVMNASRNFKPGDWVCRREIRKDWGVVRQVWSSVLVVSFEDADWYVDPSEVTRSTKPSYLDPRGS